MLDMDLKKFIEKHNLPAIRRKVEDYRKILVDMGLTETIFGWLSKSEVEFTERQLALSNHPRLADLKGYPCREREEDRKSIPESFIEVLFDMKTAREMQDKRYEALVQAGLV